MILPGQLQEELLIMPRVSNLVKNKLAKIVSDTEKDHLKNFPSDIKLAGDVAGGFYSAIQKLKEEKRCPK